MTKTRLLGHKLTVSFAHPDSYPKESTLRDQFKYDVVQKDTSKRSSDVTATVCSSTSDNVEITGGLASSIKSRSTMEIGENWELSTVKHIKVG